MADDDVFAVQHSSTSLMSAHRTLDICRTCTKINYRGELFVKNVQVLSEGTSDTSHRPFSNRGNQITAIKHNKIFNCSEPVAYHHGSRITSAINLVTLGLVAMVYYCVRQCI